MCGDTLAIQSVTESQACVYTFVIAGPLACQQADVPPVVSAPDLEDMCMLHDPACGAPHDDL